MAQSDGFLGYTPGNTPLHKMNAALKLTDFLLLTVAFMVSYDTRFLVLAAIFSVTLFVMAKIRWKQVSLVMKLAFILLGINLLSIYALAPGYGAQLYGTRHVLIGSGAYALTQEQLFYEFNLLLKYFITIPLALVFIMTTNPSEFASSLNKLGISYKISYSVALALRYIPDIQDDYFQISMAQQARGLELSKKSSLKARISGSMQIVMPLILSSFERIDTISNAMELRRFGRNKKRTWYTARKAKPVDVLCMLGCAALLFVSIGLFQVNGGRFYNPFAA